MNKQDKPGPKRDFSFDILCFIAAMFSVLLIRDYLVGANHVREIPYSEFKQRLDNSEVKDWGGPLRTGAADDLARATDLARNMVTRFRIHL